MSERRVVSFKGNYIAGEFMRPQSAQGSWKHSSPADLNDVFGNIEYSYSDIDRAIESGKNAFSKWRKFPIQERSALLSKYKVALQKRTDELAEVLAREVGKPLWEAKSEVQTMLNKIDITLNESLRLVADLKIESIMDATDGLCQYRPLGVLAVIGPFNFPGHLPNGHIVPALATGNVVLFKPSEKAPLVGQIMADCFHEAGFPPGVFNLVQGEREVGRRICVHEGVDGVLFTGSYDVGLRIKQDTLQQHWKLLALEMGGKNAAIVFEDADLEHAIAETLTGAFMTTGQRCSATSRILVHESLLDRFVARFHERSKAFSIAHPLENPFMGPLIDQGSVDRFIKYQGIAQREGFELVMRGKSIEVGPKGNYVTPAICLLKAASRETVDKSVFLQSEIFAPAVGIVPFASEEDALYYANSSQFGLVASVFTTDRSRYQRVSQDLEVGLVNWNRATVGASSRLPFGGLKKSGNHFPTALTSTFYCTYPVSSLEVPQPKVGAPQFPGLNWK